MKAQPLAYNKDNQEDKEPLFDTVDTLADTLAIMTDLVATGLEADAERMRAAAREGFATATDLADYLVRKGVPFRDAHEAVARAVRHAEAKGVDLGGAAARRAAAFSRRGRRRRVRRADARRLGREPRPSGRHRAGAGPRGDRRGARGARLEIASLDRSATVDTGTAMDARNVAFLGLGVMGYPMAGHLAKAGHRVTVYNRTPAKAAQWVAQHGGLRRADARGRRSGRRDRDDVRRQRRRRARGGARGRRRARGNARRRRCSSTTRRRRRRSRASSTPPRSRTASASSTRRCPAARRARRTASSRSWSAATPTRSRAPKPCSRTTRAR